MASIAGRPERIRPLAEAGRGCTPLSLIEPWQAVLEAEWTEAFGCERQRLLLPTQAVPLLAIALVIPDMRLTPPEKGWRVKNHPAAVAIDALTLASRAPSIVYEVNRPRWLGLGIGLGLDRTSSP